MKIVDAVMLNWCILNDWLLCSKVVYVTFLSWITSWWSH